MASPSSFNYTVDITHHASLAFVRARAADGKKFFLYESFTVPHAGGWGHAPSMPESGAPVPSDGRYASESWPEVERDHAAVITYLDNCVGELIAELKTGGLYYKTLIFFASDNGAHLEGGHDYHFFNSTGGLLGHKRSLYEGGYRSPTMVRWPAAVAPAVSDVPFAFWDVIPTLVELIGADEPAAAALDGISIAPTLLGKPQQPRARRHSGTGRGRAPACRRSRPGGPRTRRGMAASPTNLPTAASSSTARQRARRDTAFASASGRASCRTARTPRASARRLATRCKCTTYRPTRSRPTTSRRPPPARRRSPSSAAPSPRTLR